MMENVPLSALKANPKNPRKISEHDYNHLVQSIQRFGDLSGIVSNRRTGQLVGGHQRIQAFKKLGNPPITITQRFEQPGAKGTTALGYVLLDGEAYAYREVDWDEGFEAAANIAANRIQGDFDLDGLAQLTYEISQMENAEELLDLTGQDEKEIDNLLKSVGVGEDEEPEQKDDGSDKLEFRMTREQREIVEEAIGHITATREIPHEEAGSKNGSALYYMARDYLDRVHADQS